MPVIHDMISLWAEDLSQQVARACEAGDHVTAERIASEAVEMVHKHRGERDLAYAEALKNLALAQRGLGKHEEADATLRTAMEALEKEVKRTRLIVATMSGQHAQMLEKHNLFSIAESCYRQELAFRASIPGGPNEEVAACHSALARIYRYSGQLENAEHHQENAVGIRMSFPENWRELAISLIRLAEILHLRGLTEGHDMRGTGSLQGRSARAFVLLQEAEGVLDGRRGSSVPYPLALFFLVQALLQRSTGGLRWARLHSRFARTLVKDADPPEHLLIGQTLNLRGEIAMELRQHRQAGLLFEQARLALEEARSARVAYAAPELRTVLENLVALARESGDHAMGEKASASLMELWEKSLETNDRRFATALGEHGARIAAGGDLERAVTTLVRALELHKRWGTNDPVVGKTHFDLANCLQKMSEYSGAEYHYLKAFHISLETLGNQSDLHLDVNYRLAGHYHLLGNFAKAETHYLWSIPQESGADDVRHAGALWGLGQLLETQNRGARKIFEQALELTGKSVGEQDYRYGMSLALLAGSREDGSDEALDEQRFRQAIAILRRSKEGEGHLGNFLNNFGRWLDNRGQHDEAEALYPKPVPCEKKGEKIAKLVSTEGIVLQDSVLLAKFDDGLLLKVAKVSPPIGWDINPVENKVIFVGCDSLPENVRNAVGEFDSKKAEATRVARVEAMRNVHKDTAQLHAAWEAGEPFYPALFGASRVLRLTQMAEFLEDPYIKNRKAPQYWEAYEKADKAK